MSYDILYELVCQGLSTRKIAKKMNRSQCYVKYWLKKYKLTTKHVIQTELNCIICDEPLSGRKKRFCSQKCKNQSTNRKNQSKECQKQRALDRKLKLIELKGNACSSCGYNKNVASLCFHHVDQNKKNFNLDGRKISNSSWKKCLEEASKCILLCHNCHHELHHPHLNDLII